ncbi:MAG: phosphatidylglycerophosphatase A [Candidatus Acidiferrales bacterium]
MSAKTDPAAFDDSAASSAAASASPNAESPSAGASAAQRKPRVALFIATAAGLGYLPKAPGTFGSLAGLVLAVAPLWFAVASAAIYIAAHGGDAGVFYTWRSGTIDAMLATQIVLTILVAAAGVWSANRASEFWRIKDPQRVVIDEVSGQHLTLLLGCGIPLWWRTPQIPFQWTTVPLGLISIRSVLNWKYLLLGFILFRVFDIWKPFPVRQAESLPGGWGIMADDWIAGIYAAIGLWLARAAGF